MFLVDMMRRLMSRTQVCPHCGHRQQAAAGGRRRECCEKCGASLPPPKDDGRGLKG